MICPTRALNALSLPARYFLNRFGIVGKHFINHLFQCAAVIHLFQAFGFNDLIALSPSFVHNASKYLFGALLEMVPSALRAINAARVAG